jgi:MEMO1 family protein
MKVREAYVAGRFYPASQQLIDRQLDELLLKETDKIKLGLASREIIGGIVPHAGYMYSGAHASHFFKILQISDLKFDTVIIIHPNHTGYGENIALDQNDYWESPYGKVELDGDFQNELDLPYSSLAHKFEHSGEVILPFLQKYVYKPFRIVPISMLEQNYTASVSLADKIYLAAQKTKRRILIVASTDFSHHTKIEYGRQQDDYVLKEILKLNSKGVYNQVKWHGVSMCGYGPVMTLIEYAQRVSESVKCEVLRRGHSGEVTLDDEVVNYISMLVFEA